jgi:hypothetical protein
VVVSQLENRATVLQTAAAEGLRSAWMALEGEDPELIGTLRAYPRRVAGALGDGANGTGRARPADSATARSASVPRP